MAVSGSCLCGAVRFELSGEPVWSHHCHCSRCRKTRGTHFATNVFFPLDALRFTQGEERTRAYRPPGAERFTHVFCETCGCTLPFRNPGRNMVVVPVGSLDDDPHFEPRAHIYVGSKPDWSEVDDGLPRHVEALDSPQVDGAGSAR